MKMLAFLKKDFLIMISYRFKLILQIGSFFVGMIFFYFISKMFQDVNPQYLQKYQGDYFSFVLIGLALSSFIGVGLHSFAGVIRSAQVEGTLEALLSTQTSIYTILIGNSLWSFIESFVSAFVILVFGFVFFHLRWSVSGSVISLVIILLVFIAFLSVGMLSASFIMVFKQGNPINLVFGYSSYLMGGIFFPVEVLPKSLQWVSTLLPIRYATDALRSLLLSNANHDDIWKLIARLLIFIAIFLPVGLLAFHFAVRRAKKDGSLVQY
jgi:ABC-2 type transport system permease protein